MRVSRRNFVSAAAAAGVLQKSAFERTVSAGSESRRMRVTAFPRAVGRDPSPLSEAALRHVRQMGVRDIRIVSSWVPGYNRDGEMDLDELMRVKRRAESVGLKVGAVYLRKVDTAMVRIPGASHGIAQRPSHLVAKVSYILAWFEKYRVDAGE